MFRKPFRFAAALLSTVMVFQTLPINALSENPDISAAAIWDALVASQAADVPADVPTAEDTGTSDGASKSKPPLTDEQLSEIDFSSKRLLVAANDSSIFTKDAQVLSMYDGIYMLAYADEEETKNAYTYYYDIADFVEPDSAVFIADEDYITDTAPVFSDSAPDAFTQLDILLGADEAAQSGSNKGDSLNFGNNFPKAGFNAFSEKPHYNVAIIDTGANNGVTGSVSVIGGDGVDDNGHGTAVLSAVKNISEDLSVLSVKAFDRRGVGKMSAVYAAVAYAVKQGVDVINLPFDIESADSAVLDRAVSMAKRAGITVVGTADNNDTAVYAKINNGVIFDKNYIPVGDVGLVDEEYINIEEFFPETIDYEAHDLLGESDSTDHPLLELSELEDETMDAVNSEPVVIAEESDEEIDWSKPPAQDSVTVDNTTIERIHIRWLSTSDGEETPAYFGRLKLAPDSDVVRNQMFQIDFALSGQRAYQPGEIELTFPAYLWLDRNDKEPGTLMLSVPEDPETGVEFVWKRVGDNIVITNAKPLAAASKVMIQGTFRDVAAHDMIDETVSRKFSATLTVTTPNNQTATMTSNTIDAEIDTEAHVSYANKTAYNSVSGTYDVYWMEVPSAIPHQLLPEQPGNYAYVRWYVAGTADGNQPYKMYVEDTIANGEDGAPEFGGIMLGVSNCADSADFAGEYAGKANDGTYYVKSADGKTVKALLYDGYSTIVKSAYVWTAYPKDNIPEERVVLNNTQTISVTGRDDSDRCMKNMGCSGCKTGESCVCQDCNCTTIDTAHATVETKSPTTYTFIKHWSDIVYEQDNYWGLRPDEMYLRIYCKEYSSYYPWRTILLTADYSADPSDPNPNDWTYTWSDEGQVRTYSVAETIDESKRKGVFDENHERYMDESGHRMEWQYVLRKTEYDEKTHTWTYTNEYDDGWIKFELSTLEKQVEYKYQDSDLKSTRDDLSLNQLLRGNDVYVQYPIDATISVAKQAVWENFDVNPNKFVLEDSEYYFNENEELTVADVDISEVTFDAPVVYKYTEYDNVTGEYDKEVIETPETTLYGKVGDDWIKLVILTDNCTKMKEDNGAKAEKVSEKRWKVTMPDGKLVSHIKIEFDSDDPENPDRNKVVATTDMNCTVTLHVKPTNAVKEMINKGFEGNDYLCLPLYNKAKAYAIYIGKDPKREEDEYGEERSYKTGDPVSEMESPATGYLHGRVYRVAAELEKSFTFNGQYDTTNKRAMLHSELTLTQQSDVTSRSDYDYALKMGEIPNTNSGTFYDLLPYGVEPIVKSVKFANSKDSVKNAWTISNYKNSGRTMLVVEVNLADNIGYTSEKKYKEGDGSEYYPEKGYKNTHALIFDSYCSTDLSAIDNGVLRNVAAYEADEGEIGNIEDWMGEPDDPTADRHNQSTNAVGDEALGWMTDLDPNSNAPAFVYAGDEVNLSDIPDFAVTEVEKAVSVTGSGEWSKGEKNDVNVQEGGLYSYRLLVTSATDTTTSDIILLDNIEKYVPNNQGEDVAREGDYGDNQWHGTLLSIDLSQVISAGVAPVIYYSTKDDLDISQKNYNPEEMGDKDTIKNILNDPNGDWTKVTLDKLPDVDLSTVKAIAIDMTTDKDGKPFKLGSNEQLIVYLNMRAPYEKENEHPDYFKDRDNNDTDGTDHTKNAHAYNDIYLNCVQTDLEGKSSKETGDYIHNSYTKVGIYTKSVTIKKEWDDDDDADGKRPKKITVKLLDNNGEPVKEEGIVLSEENNWTAEIERLLTYDDEGNYINYTFVEEFEGVGEYKLTVKRTIKDDGSIVYTLNNYHEPEKIDIPVTKTWQDEDSSKRPSYITVNLYAKYPDSDEKVLVRTLNIDSSNGWKGIFEGLNKYAKGKRIEYTVEEKPVYDYVPGETTGNPKEAEKGFTLLNEYYPYGNLIITKHVENGTGEARKNEFTFTLTLETQDGKAVIDRYDYIIYDSNDNPTEKKGKIGNGDEFTLKDGERIEITDIPTHIKYTVTEASKSGFTLTKTVNDTGEIVSWPATEAEFTNKYSAAGSAPIDALKLLSGRDLLRYQFSFELYEIVENTDGTETETLLRTVYNDREGNVSFGEISYTDADDGKEHKYKIVELKDKEAPGYTYDPSVYYAKVTTSDNGDGTMTCVVTYYDEDWQELDREIDGKKYDYPVFGNTYEAEGSISFRAWKVLDGRSVREGEFTFNLYDSKLKYISSASNDANGRIDFDEINYNEANAGDVYWYYACEAKDGDGDTVDVVFDTAVIGYRVEVVDNGNGTLSFNQSSYYMNDLFKVCSDCEGTGKSDGKDCTVCGGFGYTWKVDECQICDGTGYADGEVCGDCDGTGREWTKPDKSVVPTFNNSLKPGSLSVSKYTKDGTDPDQEFHFKVKLIGEKVEDGEITYEITDAEERDFPVTDDAVTTRAEQLGYTDFLLKLMPADVERDEADGNYAVMPIADEDETCDVDWEIDDEGTLILKPTEEGKIGLLPNLMTATAAPWYKNNRTDIHFIEIRGKVKANTYAEGLFNGCSNLEDIKGLKNLDVSDVTDMYYMFNGCSQLQFLEGLEEWQVQNVTSMKQMFSGCGQLQSLKALEDWQLEKVTNMYRMFYNCKGLGSLKGLDGWTVKDVSGNSTNGDGMQDMFRGCSGLKSLEGIETWEISNVKTIEGMFRDCTGLESADLSNWEPKAESITLTSLFQGCTNLKYVNLSNWGKDISGAAAATATINNIFTGDTKLARLYLENWEYTRNSTFQLPTPSLCEIKFSKTAFNAFGLNNVLTETSPIRWVSLEDLKTNGAGSTPSSDTYTGAELRTKGAAGDISNKIYVWDVNYKITFELDEQYDDLISQTMGTVTNAVPYVDYTIPESGFTRLNSKVIGWKDKETGKIFRIENETAVIPAHTYMPDNANPNVEVTLIPIWDDFGKKKADMQNGEFDFWLKGGEKATFDDIPAGTAYQVWEETPDGWVLVKQVDASGMIEPLETAEAEFYNLYQPAKTTAIIRGVKLLDNKAADTDADGAPFKFELLDKDGEVIQTVTAQDGGFIQFDAIEYEEAGTYTYTVREKNGGNRDITYDTSVWQVTVIVTKDEESGTLHTEITYTDPDGTENTNGVQFKNTTRPGSLELTKIGEGAPEDDDTIFYFRVKLTNENGMPLTEGSFDWYVKDAETGDIIGREPVDAESDEEEETESSFAPASMSVISGESDDYPVMQLADEDESVTHPVDWSINYGILTLKPKDGNEYGVLPNIEKESDVPWDSRRKDIQQIQIEGIVKTNEKADSLFYNCTALTSLEGLANLDVSNTTSMQQMFSNCSRLNSLAGLENWDVSNVTEMYAMFQRCTQLLSVEALSKWDVSSVINMKYMFNGCELLASLDGLEKWDTGNVTEMNSMFQECRQLQSVEALSKWDVSSVNNMTDMFYSCSSLASLAGLEKWDVGNVQIMWRMFQGCDKLSSVEALRDWNVHSVDNMTRMFSDCSSLTSLAGLENWDVSSVTVMDYMFYSCSSLTSLAGLENWDVQNVTNMGYMFSNCKKLNSVTALKDWKVSNVTDMGYMFEKTVLVNVDLSGWEANTDPYDVFSGCSTIEKLYLDKWEIATGDAKFGKGNSISEIRFSKAALERDLLPELEPGTPPKSSGFWVRIEDLTNPDEAETFTSEDLKDRGEAGVTYVWQAYYHLTLMPGDHAVERGPVGGKYGSIKYDYDFENPFTPESGYVFAGWKATIDGEFAGLYNVTADEVATIPANTYKTHGATVTMTAQWVKSDGSDVGPYRIEHYQQDMYSDSYTLAETKWDTVKAGTPVEAPRQTYEGFVTPAAQVIVVPPVDVEHVGQANGMPVVRYYYDRSRYTIHFDGNGADNGNMSDLRMVGGIARTLGNSFTRKGYAFIGWSVERDGEVKYSEYDSVVNLAKDGETTVTLYAQWLKVNDVEPSMGEFIVYCKAGQTIVIGNMPDGTTYEIEEINVPHNWRVTETSNVSGTIKSSRVSEASVTNVYEYTASGSATITAHKMLEGGNLTSGMFEFELYEAGATQARSETTWSTLYKTGSYVSGQPTMTETEYPVTIPGAKKLHVLMKYYTASTTAGVYVYNKEHDLIERWNAQEHTGTNQDQQEFDVEGDTVYFVAGYTPSKPVLNRAPAEFWAEVTEITSIEAVNGTVDDVIESADDEGNMVPNQWHGTAPVIFSELEFTAPGVYRYYIKEKIPADADGIVYDDVLRYVTVNVTDNGDGTLKCDVVYDDGDEPLFKNIVSGELEVAKKLEGAENAPAEIQNTEFSFLVELQDSEGNPLSGEYDYTVYDSDGEAIEEKSGTVTVVDGKAESYIHIKSGEKFKVHGLPSGAKYTVTEKDAKGFELSETKGNTTGTITAGETSDVEFTNVYTGLARLYLSAIKEFGGGVIGEGMFEFLLTQVTEDGQILDVLQEKVYAGTDGKIIFDPIDFTDEDIDQEFFFAITEVNGGLDGILYDKHRAIIKVIVTKDANGNLILVTDYTDDNDTDKVISGQVVSITGTEEEDLVFVNNTLFDLDVSKTVAFGDQERDFNFTLTLKNKNGLPDSFGWEKSDIDFGSVDITENSQEFVYEFTLKHGETIKFIGLPYGTTYEIVEEELEDYKAQATTSTADEDEKVITAETADGTIKANVSVEYLNMRIPKLPNTGGRGMKLVDLGVAMMMTGLACLLYSRKRRYNLK